MIVETNYKGHRKSKYKCDRCGILLDAKDRNSIYRQRMNENPRKCCDLCDKCFQAFERGVQKGVKYTHYSLKERSEINGD